MKKVFWLTAGLVFLVALSISGCVDDDVSPNPGANVVASSCVSCHLDEELLKQLAVEEEESVSEETSGEG